MFKIIGAAAAAANLLCEFKIAPKKEDKLTNNKKSMTQDDISNINGEAKKIMKNISLSLDRKNICNLKVKEVCKEHGKGSDKCITALNLLPYMVHQEYSNIPDSRKANCVKMADLLF